MSDYVKAKEALDTMHHDLVAAIEERDQLWRVIRRIGSETTEPDALLAQQNIGRIVNQAREAWETRRGER